MIIGTVREIWRYPVKSMGGEKMDTCITTASGLAADRGWALRDEETGEIRGGKKWPGLMQCRAEYVETGGTDADLRSDDARHGGRAPQIPHVLISFPDGSSIRSDDAQVNACLSEYLGARVSVWPLQPANDKAHYRRRQPGAAVVGVMGKSKTFRRVLQAIAPYTPLNAQLRGEFSREANEPIPDLSELPGELFEFATPPGTYFDAFPIHVLTTASLEAMKKANPGAAWDVRRFRPNFLIETSAELEGLVESEWAGRSVRIGEVLVACTIPTVRCGMTMHAQRDLPKDPSILRSIVREAEQNFGMYAKVEGGGIVRIGDSVKLLA
ncbi:MAG: MOSC domain-containing protein [Candidatus Hydrogenedentes bacterium]|nr:MOSC domain-containing protein [Candidatus Hydrogenedentota bacterium]